MKLAEVDYDPFAASPIEHAIADEGVSPQVADIARSIYQQESSSGKNTTTSHAVKSSRNDLHPAYCTSIASSSIFTA